MLKSRLFYLLFTQVLFIMSLVKGFTLIESLVTFAIIAILFLIAVPSMTSLTQQNRATSGANRINTLLIYARNQSTNILQNITLCPLKNNICTQKWSDSIDVFIDVNKNKQLDPRDILLKKSQRIHANDSLTFASNGITFTPQGLVTNLPASPLFKYCSGDKMSIVKLHLNGRSKIEKVTNIGNCP